jgi:hypothetical protein
MSRPTNERDRRHDEHCVGQAVVDLCGSSEGIDDDDDDCMVVDVKAPARAVASNPDYSSPDEFSSSDDDSVPVFATKQPAPSITTKKHGSDDKHATAFAVAGAKKAMTFASSKVRRGGGPSQSLHNGYSLFSDDDDSDDEHGAPFAVAMDHHDEWAQRGDRREKRESSHRRCVQKTKYQ